MKVIATRLTRGADLKLTIAELVKRHCINAGAIASCVGCISSLKIRLAGANDELHLNEPLEIVSLAGTLTPDHQHIHIAVANQQGHVIGGHLMLGTLVDTTAELILHSYPHLEFFREFDGSTGYSELTIAEQAE